MYVTFQVKYCNYEIGHYAVKVNTENEANIVIKKLKQVGGYLNIRLNCCNRFTNKEKIHFLKKENVSC